MTQLLTSCLALPKWGTEGSLKPRTMRIWQTRRRRRRLLPWLLLVWIATLHTCRSHFFPPLDHDTYIYHAIQLRSDLSRQDILEQRAADVATHAGCQLLGRVGSLTHHYLLSMRKSDLMKRGLSNLSEVVDSHHHVLWSQVQVPKKRLFRRSGPPESSMGGSLSNEASAVEERFKAVTGRLNITDPGLKRQWHLVGRLPVASALVGCVRWKWMTTYAGPKVVQSRTAIQ